ncbi:MAG: serine--tRNA ligase [Candidatus Pacearchaeota archaeon]|jgi:seryl-tRNA synthetase
MIDIKLIRENPEAIKKHIKERGYDLSVDEIVKLDKKWREYKKDDDDLRAERNKVSESINQAKKAKKPVDDLLKKAKQIPLKLNENEKIESELRQKIDYLVAVIPNIQMPEVPRGDASANKLIHEVGKIIKIKDAKSHLELGESLGMIDIKRATKVAGAGFYILTDKIAKLQRALVQFMLDFHVQNGFTEINPPQLVNRKAAFGTGNLPKFDDQLFKTNDELILVPTAEVVVTNVYADEVLVEKDLPKKFCSFTQCYRTEAGRKTGEEGLFRLREFEKVEMVYLCKQEDSKDFLEEMTENAEKILKQLEIPFRRILLSTEDAGFSSAKTYDIEVWSPAMDRWLETSSCSNCTDFQARRMNTRYQAKDGTIKFVHTLNGSGVALPRLMIALMENNQQKDGSILIPKVLQKYTGFSKIEAKK